MVKQANYVKIDVKDKRILYELEKNARQPISQIARKVRLSKETTNYRIKRLEKKRVIMGYSPIINSDAIGYNLYRLRLKLQNTTPKKEEEIINHLKRIPLIARLSSVEGNWDFLVSIRAKTVFEFKRLHDKLLQKYGKYIESETIAIVTTVYYFLHDIFFEIKDRSYIVSGEDKEVKIDKTDMEIINLLIEDCRTPTSELANKLHFSANAIKQRIRRLIKKRVLLAFKMKPNDYLFGYQHYRISLTLQRIDQEKKEEIISYLSLDPRTYLIIESIGSEDLEFEVHVKSSSELHFMIKELRNRFKYIRDHQTLLFCGSHLL